MVNYQTVASFGHNEFLLKKYQDLLIDPMKSGIKKAHISGFVYGFSESMGLVCAAI